MRGVYGILDLGIVGTGFVRGAAAAMADAGIPTIRLFAELGDADLVALCRQVRPIAIRQGARFLLNERADVAAVAGADGVHLSTAGLVETARSLLPDGWIGVAVAAAHEAPGADYVSFGPAFPDGMDGLRAVCAAEDRPVVATGGIDLQTCRQVIEAGATAAAMDRALLEGDMLANVYAAMKVVS